MNIPIIINGEKKLIQSPADTSLLTVLRKEKFIQVKRGCEKGICGSCMVMMNDKIVPSCKIPISLAINKSIETLDYFSKTEIYNAIIKGFTKAGIKLCGYCNAGKIFTAKAILLENERPTRAKIQEYIKDLSHCCTDNDSLINGIIYAFEFYSKL